MMKDDKYIIEFYNEIKNKLDGEYKIILEPGRKIKEDWIEYDKVKWEIEDSMIDLVQKLIKENTLSLEEKILKLYEFICLNYIYDVNVLYFFKKDLSDPNNIKYIAVDWYGRIVGNQWIENRKKHNRRICYEFARFYAKAINELITPDDEVEAFMLGDRENLHYVVGLSGEEYSVILDLDDFNNIKDLTRLKLGLSIKGIRILIDKDNKFKKVLDSFNKNRPEELPEIVEAKDKFEGKDNIKYFRKVLEILSSYNLDSQGFFEYMRAIIESEGIEIEKIWKEVKGVEEKRYVRCLIFNFDSKDYLLDSLDKTLKVIDKENLDINTFVFRPEENYYSYYGG